MVNQPKSKHIPRATIQRLATYVQVLENLSRDGVEVISSNPLAEACGVNGSQVRKDLAYFGEFGIRGVGYHVTSLIASITSALGVDREWRMALVGVGNLGKAILNHGEFRARGFNIVGIMALKIRFRRDPDFRLDPILILHVHDLYGDRIALSDGHLRRFPDHDPHIFIIVIHFMNRRDLLRRFRCLRPYSHRRLSRRHTCGQ